MIVELTTTSRPSHSFLRMRAVVTPDRDLSVSFSQASLGRLLIASGQLPLSRYTVALTCNTIESLSSGIQAQLTYPSPNNAGSPPACVNFTSNGRDQYIRLIASVNASPSAIPFWATLEYSTLRSIQRSARLLSMALVESRSDQAIKRSPTKYDIWNAARSYPIAPLTL